MSRKNSVSQPQQLQVGAQTISYTLIHTNRKSVGITIRPDMSVEVRAPYTTTPEAVAEIMRQRAPWILRHLQKFAQRPAAQPPSPKPKGASYLYMGNYLPLKVESQANGASGREGVSLDNDVLHVVVKDAKDKTRVNALLERWSREQAEVVFLLRMTTLFGNFRGMLHRLPNMTIRRMKARWGSCSATGSITLNLKLIHLDESLIDYVIMHELCHLIEHNHSKRYYALLNRMMPDWEKRRQRLNDHGMPE